MTKSEFVDQVAQRRESVQEGGRAAPSTPVLDTIEDDAAARGRGDLHRVRQVPRRQRGARQGRNPRTGEPIQIAASRVPRFSAGSSSRRPSSRLDSGAGTRTGAVRRASRGAAVAERDRRSSSGSIPIRPPVAAGVRCRARR